MQAQLAIHEAYKATIGQEPPRGTTTHERFKGIVAIETPKETCNSSVLLVFNLVKVKNVQKVECRNHKKFEDATSEAHKAIGKKPSQVKVKVGGKLMGFVMEKISGMIMSALWLHRCWM